MSLRTLAVPATLWRALRRAVPPLAVVGIALAAGLLRGGDVPVANAAPLEGAPWRLASLADATGRLQPVLAGTEVTATFEAGRVSGTAGCNNYTAGFALAQDTSGVIRISAAASTQRLCVGPEGLMEQEAAYLAALQRVGRYTLVGDDLTLRDAGGGALLVFQPQPQTPLAGTLWAAESYNNGRGGLQSLAAGTEITARFESGRVAGSAGCNSYTAGYTLPGGGGAIAIAPPASTRMACTDPPGVMEQEAAYLAALPTAVRYRIEGDRLSLETADGARVATYSAVAAAGAGAARAAGAGGAAPAGLPRTGTGPGDGRGAPAAESPD